MKLHAVVASTQAVIASAYDRDGKANACTLAFYMVSSHMQLIGEVKNILANESILNDQNKILLSKLKPIIYDEEGRAYLALGEKDSDAFKPGIE